MELLNQILAMLKEILGLVEKIQPSVPEIEPPKEEPVEEKPKEYIFKLTVVQRQQNLKILGYYTGTIDGKEGSGTKNAYKSLQKKYGLTVDGIYGEMTEKVLMEGVSFLQGKLGLTKNGISDKYLVSAVVKYQKSLAIVTDGICGATTYGYLNGTNRNPWNDIKYFKAEEFACKCGGVHCNGFPVALDMNLVRKLDAERARMGRGCTISSGVRCYQHNKDVGGVSNSKHKLGKAVDRSYGVYFNPSGYGYSYRITGTWYHSNL